jgi:hypothetical protein
MTFGLTLDFHHANLSSHLPLPSKLDDQEPFSIKVKQRRLHVHKGAELGKNKNPSSSCSAPSRNLRAQRNHLTNRPGKPISALARRGGHALAIRALRRRRHDGLGVGPTAVGTRTSPQNPCSPIAPPSTPFTYLAKTLAVVGRAGHSSRWLGQLPCATRPCVPSRFW